MFIELTPTDPAIILPGKTAVYQTLEDVFAAYKMTPANSVELYTWQSGEGGYNLLRIGASNVNSVGYVLLPVGLPDLVELPDDEADDDAEPDNYDSMDEALRCFY